MPVNFRSGRLRPGYDPPPRLPPSPANPRCPLSSSSSAHPTITQRRRTRSQCCFWRSDSENRAGPGLGIESAKSVEPPEIQNLLRLLEASSRPFHVKQNERAAATPSERTSSILEPWMHRGGCGEGTCRATRPRPRTSRAKLARWVPHRDALLPISGGIASGTTRACHPGDEERQSTARQSPPIRGFDCQIWEISDPSRRSGRHRFHDRPVKNLPRRSPQRRARARSGRALAGDPDSGGLAGTRSASGCRRDR